MRLGEPCLKPSFLPSSCNMEGWSWNRVRAAFLAVLLGLAMSLSFVQGSVMAADMAVAADGAHHGPSHCDGCAGGDHNDTDTGTCLSVCGSAAQGLLPGEPAALPLAASTAPLLAHLLTDGQTCLPDHGPPKALTLS